MRIEIFLAWQDACLSIKLIVMRRPFLWLIPFLISSGSLPAAEQKYKLSDVPTEEQKSKRDKQKDPEDAMPTKSNAQIANEVAEEFFALGTKFMNEGNYEQAEGYFDRVLILNPNHKGAKEGIERIMKTYNQPAEQEEKTAAKEPVNSKTEAGKKTKGRALERAAEKDQAKNIEKSDKLYIEALSANQTGNVEDALKLCKRSLVLNPDNLQAQRMLERLDSKPTP